MSMILALLPKRWYTMLKPQVKGDIMSGRINVYVKEKVHSDLNEARVKRGLKIGDTADIAVRRWNKLSMKKRRKFVAKMKAKTNSTYDKVVNIDRQTNDNLKLEAYKHSQKIKENVSARLILHCAILYYLWLANGGKKSK